MRIIPRHLVWFRRDLRLDDHQPLHEASRKIVLSDGSAVSPDVIPLVILDPREFDLTDPELGIKRTGPHRVRFQRESIDDLASSIRSRGGRLVVMEGDPREVIHQLVQSLHINRIYTMNEIGIDEIFIQKDIFSKLSQSHPAVDCHVFDHHTLLHPSDLGFELEALPDIFTQFRKRVERKVTVRPPLETRHDIRWMDPGSSLGLNDWNGTMLDPAQDPEHDPRAVLTFQGGETAGLARVRHYLWESDSLRRYKETRNGLLGSDYSSKCSPWLANGTVSVRRIHAEVMRYEQERVANESTYWLIFELLWRDYFQFSALKHGARMFSPGGIQGKAVNQRRDVDRFRRWAEGRTGQPFIDANMTELNRTGFMSNRGRQNVASFLSQDLGVDWRMGARYFESMLIDDDVASNWGNWAYNSTVGHDPRNRRFDVERQAWTYDRHGAYVRHWSV